MKGCGLGPDCPIRQMAYPSRGGEPRAGSYSLANENPGLKATRAQGPLVILGWVRLLDFHIKELLKFSDFGIYI